LSLAADSRRARNLLLRTAERFRRSQSPCQEPFPLSPVAESFKRRGHEPSGSLAPTSASAVSDRPAWSLAAPPSPALDGRVHPLLGFSPLQSAIASTRPPRARGEHLPWGFVLHRDISARSPLAGRDPALPMFRPQCFAHSRRLAPPHTLPACFIRLPRPRFPLQGFSPPTGRASSSLAVSLLPLAALACVRVSPSAPAPAASTSGRCSDQRSVVSSRPIGPTWTRSPPEVRALRGASSVSRRSPSSSAGLPAPPLAR
jgi:hypothetical protein